MIRVGESLHVIRMMGNRLRLVPCSTWYWEGDADPDLVARDLYRLRPIRFEHLAGAQLQRDFLRMGLTDCAPVSRAEPSDMGSRDRPSGRERRAEPGDEAGSPTAALLAIPEGQDAGSEDGDDALANLRADIGRARGKALLLETTASGFGEGKGSAPHRDWSPTYLHPSPTESMVSSPMQAFARMLAACGVGLALFDDSDGTAKREAAAAVFPQYRGAAGARARARANRQARRAGPDPFRRSQFRPGGPGAGVQKLVAGGVAVNEALATSGLLAE